jgi:structural maintenance of chromosome 4
MSNRPPADRVPCYPDLVWQSVKSKPHMAVLAEYRRRRADFDAVASSRDTGKKRYDDLRQTGHYGFLAGFNAISSKLKEMYQVRHDL